MSDVDNINYIKNNIKQHYTREDLEVARGMFNAIHALYAHVRAPNFTRWANDVRLMRERDRRSHAEILALFDFANRHDFWCRNILSPATLRKQWDRLMIERDHVSRVSRPAASSAADKVRAANHARRANGKVIDHE